MITALIIFVYVVMWVFTGVIIMNSEDEIWTAVFVGLFWPVALPVIGVAWLVDKLSSWWCNR